MPEEKYEYSKCRQVFTYGFSSGCANVRLEILGSSICLKKHILFWQKADR